MGIFNKIKKILKKDNIGTNVDDKKGKKESILSPQENTKSDEAQLEPIQESKINPENPQKYHRNSPIQIIKKMFMILMIK